MKTKALNIIVIFLLSAVLMGCGGTNDISFKIVEKSGYFTVGYDPLDYHTKDGYGLAINIIKHAAERMGVEAPIYPVNDYDWEVYLQNNDIDAMLCKTSEENLQSATVFTDNIIMISRDTENINKVGVIDSNACIEQKNILNYDTSYEYFYYSDKSLLYNDLEIGVVDAAIISEYDALSENSSSDYTVRILSESPIYFIVSNEKQSFYEALNAVLQQMSLDGTIARLKSEYIESLN